MHWVTWVKPTTGFKHTSPDCEADDLPTEIFLPEICIIDGYPCVKATKSNMETIQNLPTPKPKQQARGLIGLCKYLSMSALDLQN